jgi:hypothetical protein
MKKCRYCGAEAVIVDDEDFAVLQCPNAHGEFIHFNEVCIEKNKYAKPLAEAIKRWNKGN